MIDEKNFFEQPIKNHVRSYENTQKIAMRWLHNWLLNQIIIISKSIISSRVHFYQVCL